MEREWEDSPEAQYMLEQMQRDAQGEEQGEQVAIAYRSPTRHDIGRMVEVSNNGEQWQSGPLVSIRLGRQGNYYQIDAIQVFLFCRVPVSSPDPIAELAIAADWLAQQGWDEAARVVQIFSNKSLFLVSTGEYSDYSVRGVFTSRELAQQYMDTLGGYWNEIEEVSINAGFSPGLKAYSIIMDLDGNTRSIEEQSDSSYFNSDYAHIVPVTKFNPEPYFRCECFARDVTHAIKIANERRTKLIATTGS